MVDPLSISASIVALLQLTGNIIKYLNGLANASADLKRLSLELCTVHGLLSALKETSTDLDPSTFDSLDGRDGIFAQLDSLLEQLTSKLGGTSNKLGKLLHWPLQKGDTKDLLSSVERQKSSLSLILQNSQRAVSKEIGTGVSELCQGVRDFKSALRNGTNSRVMRWLAAPDPSSNHNAARVAHSPTTGDWFLESDDFKTWWATPNDYLWIHGLPGCGKSVLASTIIEHLNSLCDDRPDRSILYFYFDFREEAKQTVDGFLRSLLAQLACNGSEFPPELQDLYIQRESKGQQPTTSDLSGAFFSIIDRCKPIYLIVDALDECSPKYSLERQGMLGLFQRLREETIISVNVLILSRRELDIEDGLGTIVSRRVGIQNDTVDADIRVHVRKLLAGDIRLKRRSTLMKAEIEASLVNGAHGMFRWVVCQIENLRQCRRVSILRDALKDLPKDLDETYDRILSSIPKPDRRDAIAALQLLAASMCAVSVADLAEAVVIEPISCSFDPNDRLPDFFDIVDVLSSLVTCSCRLIRLQSNKAFPDSGRFAGEELATEVRLAHYSVKEYIMSDRIRRGNQSYFYVSQYEAHKNVAEMCLIYLLQFDQPGSVSRDTIRDYPFCLYAAEYWFQHAKAAYDHPDYESDPNSNMTLLSIRLLNLGNPSFINWLRLCDPCQPRHGVSDKRTRDSVNSPLYYACYMGLLEVVHFFKSQDASIAASAVVGPTMSRRPWNGAILGKNERMVRCLLDAGVDVNSATDCGKTALHQASFFGHESIVRLLIQNGAQLELRTGPVAPYSEVPEPIIPILEDCNLSKGRRQRRQISIALERYMLKKQMCLESLKSDILPIDEWQVWGHGYVLATLMYGGDRAETDFATGWTALHDAAWNGRQAVTDLLLHHGADLESKTRYGWTPLHFAVWNAHTAVVRNFIYRGASLSITNVYGWTPLHAASAKGHESIVRLLLDNNADIEAETSYGWTSLFGAASEERIETLTLLLERGANPDASNSYGGTALHRVARAGSRDCVNLLLQHGASRSIQSVYGTTAMDEAELHGHDSIVQLLKSCPDCGKSECRGTTGPGVSNTKRSCHVRHAADVTDSIGSNRIKPVSNSGPSLNNGIDTSFATRHGLCDGNTLVASAASASSISVLFVCRSNLLRSPMAEAVFRSFTKSNPRYGRVDAAGTAAYRKVDNPDPQTMKTLTAVGFTDYGHVEKKICGKDFAVFDYVMNISMETVQQLQRSLFTTVEDNVVEIQACRIARLAAFGYFVGTGVETRDFPQETPSSFESVFQQVGSFSRSFIGQVLDDNERVEGFTENLCHATAHQNVLKVG